jgi:hypothetical protein
MYRIKCRLEAKPSPLSVREIDLLNFFQVVERHVSNLNI